MTEKKKRWREPKATPGQIKIRYGKLKNDVPGICYAWGEGTSRADTHLLHNVFSSVRFRPGTLDADISLYDELEKRGYDLTTIEFSIKKSEILEVRE